MVIENKNRISKFKYRKEKKMTGRPSMVDRSKFLAHNRIKFSPFLY